MSVAGLELQAVCRWLRAELSEDRAAGRPPQCCGAHSRPVVRAGLLRMGDEARRRGLVTRADVDAWASAEGLYARSETRLRVARSFGTSPRQLDQLRLRVSHAIAHVWDPRAFEAAAAAPSLDPVTALAQVHSEAAALASDADDATLAVVLQAREFGLGVPAWSTAVATPRQRAARHRARPAVHARRVQEQRNPLLTPARLAGLPHGHGLTADDVVQASSSRPDPEWLFGLVERAEAAGSFSPLARSLAIVATHGYATYDDAPPDRLAAAKAWRLAIASDLPARDMAALWRLRHLRNLVGPDHPLVLEATVDAAQVLRVFGYVAPAKKMLQFTLKALPGSELSAHERDLHILRTYSAFGCRTPFWVAGRVPLQDVRDMAAAADAAERLVMRSDGIPTDLLETHARRHLFALGQTEAADSYARRPKGSRRLQNAVEEMRRRIPSMGAHDRTMTWLTLAHLARDFVERDAYQDSLVHFDRDRRAIKHYDFVGDVLGHQRFARKHGWPIPELETAVS